MVDYLRIGVVATTHGIKGEVKVYVTTSEPERFQMLDKCYLAKEGAKPESYIPVHVDGVKYFKQQVILKFKEYNKIEEVEGFKRFEILVSREDALPLEDNEFYIADVLGADVFTEDGIMLGKLKEVFETGANDVYVVKGEKGKEILLPGIPECIKDVSIDPPKMVVHLMEGLLD